jgi:hypothetical protein
MPNPDVQWLRLSCPSCRARCRVRKGATLASCRCPQCGQALAKPPQTSPPPGEEEETGQSSHVRAHEKPARGPVAIVTEEEVERELRKDDPELPANPLWQGVYSSPWQPEHLRAWLLFGFGLCVMAFLATAVCHITYRLQLSTSYLEWDVYRTLSKYFVGALMGATLWTGFFAASYFLELIQQTAGGNEEFDPPDDMIAEKIGNFLYLAWIAFCALAPLGALYYFLKGLTKFPVEQGVPPDSQEALIAAALPKGLLVAGFLLLSVLVYPHVLLGGLTNRSWILLLSDKVSLGLLKRPLVLLVLYAVSVLIMAPCLVLGVVTVLGLQYWLAPVMGFAWSAALLIYGRLLGRVGWVLTDGDEPTTGRRRKRKKRKRTST